MPIEPDILPEEQAFPLPPNQTEHLQPIEPDLLEVPQAQLDFEKAQRRTNLADVAHYNAVLKAEQEAKDSGLFAQMQKKAMEIDATHPILRGIDKLAFGEDYINNSRELANNTDLAIYRGLGVWGAADFINQKLSELQGKSPQEIALGKEALTQWASEHPDLVSGADLVRLGLETYIGSKLGGAVSAIAAPLVEVGEGASLASRLASIAAKGGAFGAGFGLPEAISKIAIDNDPRGAAESLALNIGTGALFDLGGSIIKGTGRKISEFFQGEGAAQNAYLEAAGLSRSEIASQLPKQADKNWAENLIQERMPDKFSDMGEIEKGKEWERQRIEAGKTIGEIAQKADSITQSQLIHAPNMDIASFQPKLSEAIEEARLLQDSYTGKQEANLVNSAIETMEKKLTQIQNGKVGAFEGIQELSSLFSKATRESALGSREQFLNSQLSKITKDALNEPLSRLLAAAGKTEQLAEFDKAKEVYKLTSLLPYRQMQAFSALPFISPTGVTHGGVGSLVGHAIIGGGAVALNNALGTPVPHAVAAGAGLLGSMAFGKALKYWWENKGAFKVLQYLRHGNQVAPTLALAAKTDMMKSIVLQVPNVLSAMSQHKMHDVNFSEKDPIANFLGPEANGLTKDQQYDRAIAKITAIVGSPDMYAQHKKELLSIFNNNPNIQSEMSQHYDRMVQALSSAIPPKPVPKPFIINSEEKPTYEQIQNLKDVIRLGNNPAELMKDLQDNTISVKKVAWVEQMYPSVLHQMQQQFMLHAFTGKYPLDYQQRMALSILMGGPMDDSLNMTAQLQHIYVESVAAANGPAKKPTNKGSSSYATSLQQSIAGEDR